MQPCKSVHRFQYAAMANMPLECASVCCMHVVAVSAKGCDTRTLCILSIPTATCRHIGFFQECGICKACLSLQTPIYSAMLNLSSPAAYTAQLKWLCKIRLTKHSISLVPSYKRRVWEFRASISASLGVSLTDSPETMVASFLDRPPDESRSSLLSTRALRPSLPNCEDAEP